MSILIKNARLIDSTQDFVADIRIVGNKIEEIGQLVASDEDEIIDGLGKVVMPSFVDLHAHFRDPGYTYKEDLKTGSLAALAGGYTIVNVMGNTNPIMDNPDVYYDLMQRAQDLGLVDLHSVFAVTKGFDGKTLCHLDDLPEGVRFLSDDGRGILSNKVMVDAMNRAKELGVGIMVHAEDPELSPIDYRIAEDIITLRDVYLSGKIGTRLHLSHVSTEDSIDAVRRGKIYGAPVTCEVTPHHLALWDLDYRVNPPIRTKRDVKALIRGLHDGTVDAIATDHAPHSVEDKEKGAPGMVGLETSFAVCYTTLVRKRGFKLTKLSKLMSYNPAHILGLDHGELKEGKEASLVMVDIQKPYIVDPEEFQSKSKNTPFVGVELYGRVEWTMRSGKIFRR